MAPPKGNTFWQQRSSHGRKPIFSSPDELWGACEEYFDWVEKNPLREEVVFQHRGKIVTHGSAKIRAMTVEGLCIFLDIAHSTWQEYRKKNGFSAVTTRVDEIIRTQKFEGAAAGLLNPNIIARDLGLRDTQTRELTGKDGAPLVPVLNVNLGRPESTS